MKRALRVLYNMLPFKQQLFTLLKPLGLGNSITRHLVFKGNIRIRLEAGKSFRIKNRGYYIEQHLFWHGIAGWEKNSNSIWKELSRDSQVILDIGANTGMYSLIAACVNPSAAIYAFEPIQRICDDLADNVALNQYRQIQCINKAVSNQTGTAEIHDSVDGNLYEASLEGDFINTLTYSKDKFRTLTIRTETLSDFIREHNISRIDLMKVDVETHEPKVLEGMGSFLTLFKPIMLIEVLNEAVAEALKPYFPRDEYLFYNINEETGFEQMPDLSTSSTYNFIVCPNEKEPVLKAAFGRLKSPSR